MAGKRTRGKCKYCGKEYTLNGMIRHLDTCESRTMRLASNRSTRKNGCYELAIYGAYNRDYWLIIEIKETATLKDLDSFLRDIWVECCGHLSSFNIAGTIYDVDGKKDDWFMSTESMQHQLKTVLKKGITFEYEYDFGSTTTLQITVANYRTGYSSKEKVTILSRNNAFEPICSECGQRKAVDICIACLWEGNIIYLCEECEKEHKHGDEYALPVCNSPRMGVCGYCGSSKYPDQFEPDKK